MCCLSPPHPSQICSVPSSATVLVWVSTFQAHLAVLLPDDFAAVQVVGSPGKADAAILAACKDDASAQTLYILGIQLGISSWQQHWLQSCAHRLPQSADVSEPPSYTADDSRGRDLPAEHADATQTHGLEAASASTELEHVLQSVRSSTVAPQQPGADGTNVPQSNVAAVSNTRDATDAYSQDQIAMASEESLACQNFIEGIRQTEFGMGVELGASGAELRQKMNDRLGRALHRLSQDLYSKDVHFVLELVQNADDNAYGADVWPAVEFILKDTGITIMNNEVQAAPREAPRLHLHPHLDDDIQRL